MNNKTYLLLAMPILVVLLAIYVSAATTLVVPAMGGNYSTTLAANCSLAAHTDVHNATNATFYYSTAHGAAKTVLTTIQNTSYKQTDFIASVSISALSDLRTYNFTCSVINSTGGSEALNSTAKFNITVDNTKPAVSMSVTPTRTSVGRTVQYTSSISDATSGLQSSLCMALAPDNQIYNLTIGASSLDYTLDRMSSSGTWIFNCTAVDYASNIQKSSTNITTSLAGDIEEEIVSAPQQGFNLNTKAILIIAGIIAIVVILGKRKKG